MSAPDSKMLDYLKRVTTELARTKEYVAQLESSERSLPEEDPVVIVSMGCRFGGGISSPEDLWEVVRSGRCVVGPFPADRGWPDLHSEDAGGSDTDRGAFVEGVADFDADFFGISPHEARAMDPQQRLALEVAWETIERARIDPLSLRESSTGVYLGATSFGYGGDYLGDSDDLGGHLVTGNVTSVLSGRISYTLGLRGPAMTLDTACSSALVAMDLAAQSLRRGESTLALAGGAAIMSSPGVFVEFSRQGGLSADGLCKSFAAAADGTGWGEGVAMVLLEKQSDAVRLGHPVLAILRGSAVNQDGASNGLTAPNGRAQQDVIRAALADAGITADDVDAVEAHGTGTKLGDPIEATAVLAAYGRDRTSPEPLYLGSVKSNIAHTQAAAGAGSVIKSVLALQHGVLGKSLHIDAPTTEVTWDDSSVALLTDERPWPAVNRPRRIGVSGFGVSGTNAHLILEQAPVRENDTAEADATAVGAPGPRVFTVSASTPEALTAQARSIASFYSTTNTEPAELAFALTGSRSSLTERAAFVADSDSDVDKLLSLLAEGTASDRIYTGSARVDARPVFVFPGQGSQWIGMGAELAKQSAAFSIEFDRCATALNRHLDYSVEDVLFGRAGAPGLDRVDVVQPMLFAVMVSLAALWRSVGVVPSAVIGHSQGEIAAAYVAGGLSLEDAARVVAVRSRALVAITGTGGMLALAAPQSVAQSLIGDGRAAVAAVNGPLSTVVSGPVSELERIAADAAAQNIRTWTVDVDYASHSPAVDSISASLAADLTGISPRSGETVFLSTVTGESIPTAKLGAEYWVRNLRETVHLVGAVETALRRRNRVFVEISPHPILTVALSSTIEAGDSDAVVLGTIGRDDGGMDRWMAAAAAGYVNGLTVDLGVVNAGAAVPADAAGLPARPQLDLPTYPFQRSRFWYVPSGRDRQEPLPGARYRTYWDQADISTVAHISTAAATPRTVLAVGTADPEDLSSVLGTAAYLRLEPDTAEASVGAALKNAAPDVIVWIASNQSTDGHDPLQLVTLGASVVRAVLAADFTAVLWTILHGSSAVHDGELVDPAVSAVTGLLGSFHAEHPSRFGGSVDLATSTPLAGAPEIARTLNEIMQQGNSTERYATRDGQLYSARLRSLGDPLPDRSGHDARRRGTVLITGGTGGLGSHLARRVASGADRLVLLSRSGPTAPGTDVLAAELTDLGPRVEIVSCDVTDSAAVHAVVETYCPTSIFHLAGELDDCPIVDLDTERLRSSLSAKMLGATHLDAALKDRPVDEFVVFSALAGSIGVARQGAYGAANAYLDGVAAQRRARGLSAMSLACSALRPSGMVDEKTAQILEARGVRTMSAQHAFTILDHLIATSSGTAGSATTVVADVEWEKFVGNGVVADTPLVSEVLTDARAAVTATDRNGVALSDTAALRTKLGGMPAAARTRALLPTVTSALGAALGYEPGAHVDADRSFVDLGGDSLAAIRLRTALGSATGLSFPVTIAFERPTARGLAEYASELIGEEIANDAPGAMDGVDVDRLLDGLDSGLDTLVDEDARRRVASRLRVLSRRLGEETGPQADRQADTQADEAALTDDELFASLDEELGA